MGGAEREAKTDARVLFAPGGAGLESAQRTTAIEEVGSNGTTVKSSDTTLGVGDLSPSWRRSSNGSGSGSCQGYSRNHCHCLSDGGRYSDRSRLGDE